MPLFPAQANIGRFTGLLLFTVMLLFQITQFPEREDWNPLLLCRWTLIFILFFLFWLAYVIRKPAKGLASNWLEVVHPLLCAGLPFIVTMTPHLTYTLAKHTMDPLVISLYNTWVAPLVQMDEGQMWAGYAIALIGEIITVVGMLSLRGNFSIFTEVRELVTSGLYRYTRHPLYLGEMISVIGFMVVVPGIVSLVAGTAFLILQYLRAIREEKKLSLHFQEYEEYKQQTGRIFPKIR